MEPGKVSLRPASRAGPTDSFSLAEQAQQVDEQVDDVHVQGQGSEAIVVDAELVLVPAPLSQDQLRVINDEEAEDEDPEYVIEDDDPLYIHPAHAQNRYD